MADSRTSLQESILGAWTLSSYVIADVSGENREYPLGEDARGLLIYSADGFMSVQISRPGRQAYADGALHGGTDAERAAAAAGYLAYAGRYSVQGDDVPPRPETRKRAVTTGGPLSELSRTTPSLYHQQDRRRDPAPSGPRP